MMKNKSQCNKKIILVATIGEIARILNVPWKIKKKHVDLNKKTLINFQIGIFKFMRLRRSTKTRFD